ncbi:MAG: response regulator [Bacteroidota bacterium]
MIKILIIGGNKNESANIASILFEKIEQSDIIVVIDGAQGIYKAQEFQPDVILIDFILSDMKGYVACEKLKSETKTSHIPIVLMTYGHTGAGDRIKGLRAGCDAFISKPIDAGEISTLIHVMNRVKVAEDEIKHKNLELEKEVKRKTEELIIKELKYASLFEAAGNIIILFNEKNQITEWNKSAEKIYHLSKNDVIGKHPKKIIPDDKTWQYVKKMLTKIKKEKKDDDHVLKTLDPDGDIVTVLWNITKFDKHDGSYNGFLAIGQDISLKEKAESERKKSEEKLRQSEQFFKRIMDSANDAILILDKEFKIQLWNHAAIQIFGYGRKEAIGQIVFENIFPLNYRPLIEQYRQQIIGKNTDKSQGITFELSAKQKNGRTIPLELSMSGTYVQNESFLIVIAKDITLRKRNEKTLLVAKEKAEESDNLKTAFLSNMSHEIRTPMNAIVGFSQLLSNPNFDQEKKDVFIEQININSDSLLKLIEDIIYISKIEAGKVDIIKTECLINKLLEELHTSFLEHKRRMDKNKVDLALEIGVKEPDFILNTDPQRLKQIFTNLLGNALKFTEEGSVEFGYQVKNKNFLEFYVKDTGMGIKKEKLKYVFDRFTKVSAKKTKLYGGTGLGLSISKHLVDHLGGKIRVESVEDKGSKFIFTHPYKKYFSETTESHIETKTTIEYLLKNTNILVAEDEEINFLFLKETLRQSGANVDWAKNGKEAVDLAINKEYDLILMDMKMPVMDGYDAIKKIKPIKPNTPIIAQTAYALPEEQKIGYEAGCDFYLSKPIDPINLINTVRKHLP